MWLTEKGTTVKLIGFTKHNDGTYKEYLPYNEQLSSDVHKRAIFFNMFNMYLDKELRFTKQEIALNASLEQTFRHKIHALIDISCIKKYVPARNITLDMTSSLLIHAYFLRRNIHFPLPKKPLMLVGKVISLIYKPSGLSLMLDLDDMFLHLVYERIKRVNRYADVYLNEKSILIKDKREHVPNSLIIPSYRKLDKERLYSDEDFIIQMNSVEHTINKGEISQVFLVYPKHPNFKKHINIKLPYQTKLTEDEYKVKVMPYSFSFCAKKTKKPQKQHAIA